MQFGWDRWARVGVVGLAVAMMGQATASAEREGDAPWAQIQEMVELRRDVSMDQWGDIHAAAKQKGEAEKWSSRQRVAWTIAELKKAREENKKAGGVPVRGTGDFGSHIISMRFFSDKAAAAVTMQGVVVTEGSLDKWKGVAGWARSLPFTEMVGGSDKVLWLVSSETTMVVVKEGFERPKGMEYDVDLRQERRHGKNVLTRYVYSFGLWRWTAAEGLKEIRKLPRGPSDAAVCAFADERVGAFAEGKAVQVTVDAGKTWRQTALKLERGTDGLAQMAFCGERELAVTTGSESVALLELDEKGHARERWRSGIFGRLGYSSPGADRLAYDAEHKLLWVFSEDGMGGARMRGFGVADGKVRMEFSPNGKDETTMAYSVAAGKMFVFSSGPGGAGSMQAWDIGGAKPRRTSRIHMENNGGALTGAYPVGESLYLVLNHQRLVKWNGKEELPMPMYLTSDIWRPTVDTTVLEAAEEKWPPGDGLTKAETRAMQEAMAGLSGEQHVALLKELEKKRDDFDTYREQSLWMTKRARELSGK